MFSGLSRSVSRVAGPPPRTSTPQTAPSGATTTVQPVPAHASCAGPTQKAGRSDKGAAGNMSASFVGRDGSCRPLDTGSARSDSTRPVDNA